jgi:PAS domain S-box-containing protein
MRLGDRVVLLLFSAVVVLIGTLNARLRRALERAEEARAEAEARTREAEQAQRTLESLHAGEARFRAIWESAADALAISDPNGLMLAANPAYYELFGYTPQQVIGQPFSLIFPEEQRAGADEQYGAVFNGAEIAPRFEAEVRRADGSETVVEASYDFIVERGRRVAMISMIRDVSERRRLARLQRDFIAMVAHDLRNPLASIRGFAQLLERDAPERTARQAQAIVSQADRMNRLLQELLDAASLEAGRLPLHRARLDLLELLRGQVEQVQAQSTIHPIRLDAPAGRLEGEWDGDRLGQVFQNLLSNAIKYSPEGGDIDVRVRDLGIAAEISISDRGVGIAPDLLPRLFDQYYRVNGASAEVTGLGLGLYIARELVEAHGGRIWAESGGEGRGSTFRIRLPYAAPAGAA